MTGRTELAVTLRFTADDLADLIQQLEQDLAAARETASHLEELRQRAEDARRRIGLERPAVRRLHAVPDLPDDQPAGTSPPVSAEVWEAHVVRARRHLEDRGIDPNDVAVEDLLDPEEVTRLERRHGGGFTVGTRLDGYDVLVAAVAGLTGALVDALVVRVPADQFWKGLWLEGSPLTRVLRELSQNSESWLSWLAHVPFDKVSGMDVDGMGPMKHRAQTFGHDPLFGLVIGVMDIMRGTMTGAHAGGDATVVDATPWRIENPAAALALEILHLISDVGTRAGLPLPGWSALMASSLPGSGHLTVGETARYMYLRGYDSWHLLTMSTSVAAVEMVTRGYFWARPRFDEDYDADLAAEAAASDVERMSDHPRFQAISLLAHGIATAGNLGKFAFYGLNPLALNYAEWITFAQQIYRTMGSAAGADPLVNVAAHNREVIDTGWAWITSRLQQVEPWSPEPG